MATTNGELPICNRGQLAVGKLTSELIEIPQQSGATNGGATRRLMQLPKFVFVLMKFFPLHKTHSNLTIDVCLSPPLSLLSTHSFWANYSEPELCRQIYGNIIGRRQQRGEWGQQRLRKGTKFMRQAMPLNSNENESDNEMHFTAAGGCAEGQEERGGERLCGQCPRLV